MICIQFVLCCLVLSLREHAYKILLVTAVIKHYVAPSIIFSQIVGWTTIGYLCAHDA